MRIEEEVRAQRDWFLAGAEAYEVAFNKTGDPEQQVLMQAFAEVAGTLTWVLNDAD